MKKTTIALILPLFLVACGSGSSGTPITKPSTEKPSTEKPKKPSTEKPSTEKPKKPAAKKPQTPTRWRKKINPNGIILNGTLANVEGFGTSHTILDNIETTDEINKLKIDGKEIELLPESSLSNYGFYRDNNGFDEKIISGTKYQYMRFGVIKDLSSYQVFSHGLVTAERNIPNNIKAKYKGDYVVASLDSSLDALDGYTSTFNADLNFSTKTFDIKYSIGNGENIEVNDAHIDGNKLVFSGYGLSKAEKGKNADVISTVKINGHIFGKKYDEIGGVALITDKEDYREKLSLAFGGKKVSEEKVNP